MTQSLQDQAPSTFERRSLQATSYASLRRVGDAAFDKATTDEVFPPEPETDVLRGLPVRSALAGDNAVITDPVVAGYVRESLSANTQRAYQSDLKHFETWAAGSIPSSPQTVSCYLAAHAGQLSVASLARRLAAISRAHEARGYPNPTRAELTRATMAGIRRIHGRRQQEAKPLLRDDLFLVLDTIGEGRRDHRDRALLLMGFAAALRRSELVGLNVDDVERVRQGVVLHLRRSKTDQEGKGQKVAVPIGRTRWCPVSAIELWLSGLGNSGPIFRQVNRGGGIGESRLSGEAVSLVVKARVAGAGLSPNGYSGHSLRAGLATSAAQAGVPIWKIRNQTRHASDSMLGRYIRDGQLFIDNAAATLL
jgi:integrase